MKVVDSDAKIISEFLGQKNFYTPTNFLKCIKDTNS